MAVTKGDDARRLGREEGYRAGYESGKYLGRCEAVVRKAEADRGFLGYWDVRVLFVTSGKGYPYAPIDQAVIDSLRPLVREVVVGNMPGDPIRIGNPGADLETLVAQYRPDVMLVLDGMNLPIEIVRRIRESGIKTAVWLTDDPYYTDNTVKMAPYYDFMFTLELNCVQLYQEMGCPQVHYLPFGSMPQLFRPKQVPYGLRHDICFIGSAYWNRVAVFDHIAPYLASKKVFISGIWWERMQNYKLLEAQMKPGAWLGPEETAQMYNAAKIVINLHRAHDDSDYNNNSRQITAVSPNPRTFEISGCGALQLTDYRQDAARFYTPDQEMVTYGSAEELVDKMDYFLHHEEERQRISLNGLYRTVRDHTYLNRLSQLLKIVFPQ
jgi:spore maturation protein CgeB